MTKMDHLCAEGKIYKASSLIGLLAKVGVITETVHFTDYANE
jgi:hypothetical protein